MSNLDSITKTNLTSLEFVYRGKVRDIYQVDADRLLVVQTDRLSAFDVILPDPIPGKGRLLTDLSNFWFKKLQHVIPNHLLANTAAEFVANEELPQVVGRSMVVKKLTPLPVEAIVRGYLAGSGWKEYRETGAVCGVQLPEICGSPKNFRKLFLHPLPKLKLGIMMRIFLFDRVVDKIGLEYATKIRDASCELYEAAAAYAVDRGIIIADTKFEFGTDNDGNLHLIDEALTSDSSRFWPKQQYAVGSSPPSFDKQFVRDWLESISWNKKPPAPNLPEEIALKTAEKYREALTLLTN